MNLQGKTALITGGTSGIGYATAKLFKEKGADVIITGRRESSVEKAAADLGAIGIVSDQSKAEDRSALASRVSEQFGRLDILCLNAGIADFSSIETATEAQFSRLMDNNFKGPYFTLQKMIPVLNEGASVIGISSLLANAGMQDSSIYAASKASLNAMMRVAATELAPKQIRVNSINPGTVNTPILNKLGMAEEDLKAFADMVESTTPLKRFAQPEDVANMALFLASPESGHVTGAEFNVDGGSGVNRVI